MSHKGRGVARGYAYHEGAGERLTTPTTTRRLVTAAAAAASSSGAANYDVTNAYLVASQPYTPNPKQLSLRQVNRARKHWKKVLFRIERVLKLLDFSAALNYYLDPIRLPITEVPYPAQAAQLVWGEEALLEPAPEPCAPPQSPEKQEEELPEEEVSEKVPLWKRALSWSGELLWHVVRENLTQPLAFRSLLELILRYGKLCPQLASYAATLGFLIQNLDSVLSILGYERT
jgi:hypothetical protein